PRAEQREPEPREDPGALDAAVLEDEGAGLLKVRGVSGVSRQAQRHVRLDRRREVGRPAVEVGPRAVVALLRTDPRRGARRLLGREHAEELAQQEVLGVHRDVGVEDALPPPVRILYGEEGVTASGEGAGHAHCWRSTT